MERLLLRCLPGLYPIGTIGNNAEKGMAGCRVLTRKFIVIQEENKMGFSIEWEKTYQTGAHNSVWPWSDVVSMTNRYFRGDKSGLRVLELGCGAGANIPFFVTIGAEYCGIEGSVTEVQKLQKRWLSSHSADKCPPWTCVRETLPRRCLLTENLI